jgi:hypothetical protein
MRASATAPAYRLWYKEWRESRKISRCAATSATVAIDDCAAARERSKRVVEERDVSRALRWVST